MSFNIFFIDLIVIFKWRLLFVDVNAYQGHALYAAFKMYSTIPAIQSFVLLTKGLKTLYQILYYFYLDE